MSAVLLANEFCELNISHAISLLCLNSAGMVVLSSVLAAYCVATHSHEHVRTGLPYQKIRSKPYPWAAADCNLFDGECWKEFKASA